MRVGSNSNPQKIAKGLRIGEYGIHHLEVEQDGDQQLLRVMVKVPVQPPHLALPIPGREVDRLLPHSGGKLGGGEQLHM